MTRGDDAREVRDIAIECMARLDHTVALVRDGASEGFFKDYRRECGRVMGTIFYDVINYTQKCLPPISDDDFHAEWREVALKRRVKDPVPAGANARTSIEHELDLVATRMRTLASSSIGQSFVVSDEALSQLRALVANWH